MGVGAKKKCREIISQVLSLKPYVEVRKVRLFSWSPNVHFFEMYEPQNPESIHKMISSTVSSFNVIILEEGPGEDGLLMLVSKLHRNIRGQPEPD
jgi:hypothetical protein